MSLGACIPGMVERGEIDAARGAKMAALFDQLERFFQGQMSPAAATAAAGRQTLQQMASDLARRKRHILLQHAAQQRALGDLGRYSGGTPYQAVEAMLDRVEDAPFGNVSIASERIEFQAHADLQGFIERHRRNLRGTSKDRAGADDIVRELHGDASGNPRAKIFADGIRQTFERLRQRFNAAGGEIGKLDDFGMPHRHDALKVRRAGFDAWRADVLPKLDTARMLDRETGVPLAGTRLDDVLREVFETIRTNGLTGDASSAYRGGGKLANRRMEHRFLHFKGGDEWLAYDAKYGTGEPFAAIMGHVRSMADDIAAMERLGPNPDATLRLLLDTADRRLARSDAAAPGSVAGKSGGRDRVEKLWRYMKGELSTPVYQDGWLAKPAYLATRTLGGLRNLTTATYLGSAPLSSISDFNTQRMARGLAGVPQWKMMSSVIGLLNPASRADRDVAIRLGLGMRDASQAMMAAHRYFADTNSAGWTAVVADDVLRLSGLNKLTEAQQRSFGKDYYGALGEARGRAYDALEENMRETMGRYGLDAGAWDLIRAAPPELDGRTAYVNPRNIADQRVSDRLADMVLSETKKAVQESGPSTRARLTWGNPGTIAGEFGRTFWQFKGFSAGLLFTQLPIIARLGPYRGAIYGANFFIGMTLAGAASIQLREIIKGRDPRPMDDASFWGSAALQGGGVGIWGDLIGSFASDRIGATAAFMAGPSTAYLTDGVNAVRKALPKRDEEGEWQDGKPGAAAVRAGQRMIPGSSLWYTRLAYERLILDQLAEQTDPEYPLARARLEGYNQTNRQGNWWSPGETAPDRAPNYSNALGGEE